MKRIRYRGQSDITGVLIVAFFVLLIIGIIWGSVGLGVGGWGPTNTATVTVTNTYVDHSKDKSHYMVGTDQGMFEVDNGWTLHTWNADEIFGQFKVGKRYQITTVGNRVVNPFMQEYPYITAVEALSDPPPQKVASVK